MSGAEMIVLAWTVALSMAMWAGVFIVIPRSMMSLFRYRMWRVRDAAYDDILSGDLPDDPATRELIAVSETFIDNARRITMAEWVVMMRSVSREGSEDREPTEATKERLGEAAFDKLAVYRMRIIGTLTGHLVLGSISGWSSLALLLPVFLAAKMWRSIQPARDLVKDMIAPPERSIATLSRFAAVGASGSFARAAS